jgi:hypothetical protein
LEKKIDYTADLSQNFLKNKLKNLARKNPDNATIIAIISLLNKQNLIKNSVKRQDRTLVYLSIIYKIPNLLK